MTVKNPMSMSTADKVRLLRLLALTPNPEHALGDTALEFGLTVEEVRLVAIPHGYPRPESMRKAAEVLARTVHSGDGETFQTGAGAEDGTARLLAAARASKKARTRNTAERVSALLVVLRELLDAERDEARARAEGERQSAEARAEVQRLERQLAEAKAKLRGKAPVKPKATRIPGTAAQHASLAEVRAHTATILARHGVTSKAVRAWALASGVECPATGMLPFRVIEAYDTAHTDEAAA